jgi:hypothetical protein
MRGFTNLRRAGIAIALAAVSGAIAPMLASAPTYAAGASVSASPSSVPAGGTVRFSGSVPTSSCSGPVTVTDSSALFQPDGFGPQAPLSSSGAFQVNFRVPTSTPPGTYSVGLRCGGGNVGVSTSLRVTSQVPAVPSGAPQAGEGGASQGGHATGWIAGGVIATILAGLLGGVTALRWRRSRA